MSIPSPVGLVRHKAEGRPLSMVTCYDAWSAKIIDQTEIDLILVGDSVAMVVHGHDSTLPATPELMALHTAAVARGCRTKPIVADLPFLSYRSDLKTAMDAVGLVMRAGAHAVKLEGVWGHEAVIQNIVGSGVPVMGHLGLTPQSIHGLGGYKVQGRSQDAAQDLFDQALTLERLGAFAIVLECIPSELAARITKGVSIPTIGIGAGAQVDGQVLVLQDLLGLNGEFKPKFLRKFINGETAIHQALNEYHDCVRERRFPSPEESYS